MEIKYTLNKPCTDKQRNDFIAYYCQDCKGVFGECYKLRETETVLEAWGYTEEEKQKQEREHISKLSLTKREVFLALYKDKGITPEQLKAQILDAEALIEFEYATEYYRGNPLIDQIGIMLGYTSKDLDYLFINKELPQNV